MAKRSSHNYKLVRVILLQKDRLALGLALSLTVSLLAGNLVLADNTYTFQNNSTGGGIFGGVNNLIQNTVGAGNQALGVVGGQAPALSPVTTAAAGTISGVGAGLGGVVTGVGAGIGNIGVGGALPGLSGVAGVVNNIGAGLGGTLTGISGGATGVAGSALGATQSMLNNVPQSVPNVHNTNPAINGFISEGQRTGSITNSVMQNGVVQPNQVLPIFNATGMQTVRGLTLLSSSLIGSALQGGEAGQFAITSNSTQVNDNGAGRMQLLQGSLLLALPSAKNSVLVDTAVGKVWVGKQSNVLVNLTNGVLQIHNLDSAGQNVRFQMSGEPAVVAIRPGYELLASRNSLPVSTLRPADGVARRNQIMLNNSRMAVSEINLPSLIKNQPLLSALESSTDASERKVFDRLVKTAAILDLTRGRGGFASSGLIAPVTELAGETLGTTTRVVGTLVTAAGQTVNNVLGVITELPPSPPTVPGPGGPGSGGPGPGGPGPAPGPGPGSGPGSDPGTAGSASGGSVSSMATALAQAVTVASSNGSALGQTASLQSVVPTDQTRVNVLNSAADIRFAANQEGKKEGKKTQVVSAPEERRKHTPENISGENLGAPEELAKEVYGPFPMLAAADGDDRGLAAAQKTEGEVGQTAQIKESGATHRGTGPMSRAIGSAKETIRRFPEIFLALGLVIGALFILSLALARAAFVRARELEAMNARLAAEVGERKQIEQRATRLNEDLELRLSELAQLNQDLESARDQAVEGSRLKSEFVANISHEIRTPISAVIGMNQLMLNTKLDEKQKDYARLVNESAQSLLTIINDILDFSKIEAGKLEVHSVAFSLDTVLKEVSDILASSVQSKNLQLFTFIDPEVSNNFRGDPARLRQVLINLAGNAVKFTAAGEVIIHVTRVADEEGAERVKFTVQDSGIGISPEAQARLFQPFVQADGSTTRRYGGTGLGLSISKRLVELMGGQIEIQSEEGKGSTFWFELPAWAGIAGEAARIGGTHPPNKRVLLLSPQTYYPDILSKHLSTVGLNAEILRSGEESAIEAMLGSSPFSAILVDSSYASALSNVVANNPEFEKIAVAFLRNSDSAKPPSNLKASPLTTPLNQNDLVRWMVSLSRGETDKPNNEQQKEEVDQTTTEALFANTKILVAEDSVVLQRMVKSLLEKLGCNVEIVSNGKEAVEAAHTNKYNMIFMDWQMPEMDGLEATKSIRQDEFSSGKHIPIIAMTANAMQGDKDTCLSAGMDGYMSKPFKLDDLRNIITQYGLQDSES